MAGGVLRRPGTMEAAVDLAVLAGLQPAGVVAEVVSDADPTGMAGAQELRSFADEHALALVSITDLIGHDADSKPWCGCLGQGFRCSTASSPPVGLGIDLR
jgi:3,4-dihydroxy-2-butanone 4-phosphate synthase